MYKYGRERLRVGLSINNIILSEFIDARILHVQCVEETYNRSTRDPFYMKLANDVVVKIKNILFLFSEI